MSAEKPLENRAEDPGKRFASEIAKLAESRPHFFRTAYTIVELEGGRCVAVMLDKVTAEAVYPAEPNGVFGKVLHVEPKGTATERVIRAIKKRSFTPLGWRPVSRRG